MGQKARHDPSNLASSQEMQVWYKIPVYPLQMMGAGWCDWCSKRQHRNVTFSFGTGPKDCPLHTSILLAPWQSTAIFDLLRLQSGFLETVFVSHRVRKPG